MTMLAPATILAVADEAIRIIPPAWPLAATVAVNPFLGHTGDGLAEAQKRLGRAAGLRVTMPRTWYAAKIASGAISDEDLLAAIAAVGGAPASTEALKDAAQSATPSPHALPTIARLVSFATGLDTEAIAAGRIGAWAASYFDEGQAHWAAAHGGGSGGSGQAWTSWQSFATHDLTPEILGIPGFAAHVAGAPQRADEAIIRAVERLGLDEKALGSYFHSLLLSLRGWAHLARWRLWQAELAESSDMTLRDLLAISLTFETAIHAAHADRIAAGWADAVRAHGQPPLPDADDLIDATLQEAAERGFQRQLADALRLAPAARPAERPLVQAAFCIDVRSEVFRRALESIDPRIETIGFAGFFGLPLSHRRFGSKLEEAHLPVLLKPALRTCQAVTPELRDREERVQVTARAKRAWSRFRQAAVSSFAFVEAAGPLYAGKLVASSLGLGGRVKQAEPPSRLDPSLPIGTRVSIAKTVLKAMSMTGPFAPIVLLAGHGAAVVNNAHASALHCGACGGQTGEVSARTLAGLLNEPDVRQGLAAEAITVPQDTLFVAALHDTTSDELTLYDADHPSPAHAGDLDRLRRWLASAAVAARTERALKLPGALGAADVAKRGRDWSEIRPEWGLAGCSAFIAAPRSRTAGRNLEGRAFLHSYDWQADKDFGILELIITAPVVVASWISLQYYGSAVAPEAFGAGNKLLHNVVGGVGVLEGNGGAPRIGLPWQSVHDGERLMHDPLRLSVLIEAPREAITEVLRQHPGVRALFDHRWLHLLALDGQGAIAWRYARNLEWEPVAYPAEAYPMAA